MAYTELGEVTTYKRLYMQFRDSIGKSVNLTLNNPKNLDDGDYIDLVGDRMQLSKELWYTIIAKNNLP